MSDCCTLPAASRTCHCAACHVTFSGITLFDAHQAIDYNRTPAVSCIEPEALGLVLATGVWMTRSSLIQRAERAANMHKVRKAQNA